MEEKNDIQEVQPDENEQTDNNESELEELKKQLEEKDGQIASLSRDKRTLKKDLKKLSEDKSEQPDDNERIESLALQIAQITDEDEVELARDFQKRTGLKIEEVIKDDIFQERLQKKREAKAVAAATSNVKGGGGESEAKNSYEYWKAKGRPPSPEEVPNRKTRASIVRGFMEEGKGNRLKFYNDK